MLSPRHLLQPSCLCSAESEELSWKAPGWLPLVATASDLMPGFLITRSPEEPSVCVWRLLQWKHRGTGEGV